MKGYVLLVEDDETWLHTMVEAHEHAGYRVNYANNGKAAINLLKQSEDNNNPYDVVLTDIAMCEVDGIEVTNAARQQTNPPEVILLTGVGSLETAIDAVRAGAFDYLQKPCKLFHLLQRVSDAVERRATRLEQLRQSQLVRQIHNIIGTRPDDGPALPAKKLASEGFLQVGDLCINTHTHDVFFHNQFVHATRTEYQLLVCLAETPGRVITYSDIITRIRGYTLDASDAQELLRQHVRNLRRKFGHEYFVNVYGFGYMMNEPGTPPDAAAMRQS